MLSSSRFKNQLFRGRFQMQEIRAFAFCIMSEKLSLQWNDFKENINSVFGKLREDKEFVDVTLACEDGQQMEAHKAILAASSPFFEKLLSRNKHPHPLIYLKGFQSQDLLAILDFLYFGEANVHQENFDSFLAIAEELKLKGLTGQTESDVLKRQANPSKLKPVSKTVELFTRSPNFTDSVCNDPEANVSGTLAIPNEFSGDLQALDEKVKSMMGTSQNMIPKEKRADGTPRFVKASICNMCGKEDLATSIKNHIEAKHLEGISLPCDHCDKTYSSRSSLVSHKSRFHY